jgi:molybdenum cofactor cytidylyltransferase
VKTELLLLAAGQSKRFEGIKQLTYIQGQPMICHCLSQYHQGDKWIEGIDNGHIALGSNAALIIDVLPLAIKKYVIDSWENGMGHTLAKSIQFLTSDTTHVLIGLADQALITQQMIMGMLSKSRNYPKNIIAAKYAGKVGAPCIFPREYFAQLSQLSGDRGAKVILDKYSQQVIGIEMPEAALDIDTQEDLIGINGINGAQSSFS